MKVYIVIGGIEYENQDNLGVYTTREAAEAFIAENKTDNNSYDYYEIEEWEVK